MKKDTIKEQPRQKGKEKNKIKLKKQCGFIKLIKSLFIITIVLFVTSMGVFAGLVGNKLKKINYVEINKSNLAIKQEVVNQLDEYRNIALFGVDTRNIKDNTNSRSDAIIIASINKRTKDIKLVSIYRDTYMYIDGYGLDKITHAYAYGGPELAIKTLNQNLDLNIEEYVTVNFASVANIINSIGGIDVSIEDYEIEQMNKYIKDTSKNTGITSSNITNSGLQRLDGVQAVTYARIRKTAGGDYKRTERTRKVIEQTLKKAKRLGPAKLNAMLDTICENIQTNISSKEIAKLLAQAPFFEIKKSMGWPYENKEITLDRWYGVPINLEKNVKKLHKELFNNSNYEPTEQVKNISSQIINTTGIQ